MIEKAQTLSIFTEIVAAYACANQAFPLCRFDAGCFPRRLPVEHIRLEVRTLIREVATDPNQLTWRSALARSQGSDDFRSWIYGSKVDRLADATRSLGATPHLELFLEDFVERHQRGLIELLELPYQRLPWFSTLRRIMVRVDFMALTVAFNAWVSAFVSRQ